MRALPKEPSSPAPGPETAGRVERAPSGSAAVRFGQGLLEYAVILALVAIVTIVVLRLMGGQIQGAFQDIIATLEGP